MKELASGLRFPEGPVCLSDGSVALVEVARGTIIIIDPNGGQKVLADLG